MTKYQIHRMLDMVNRLGLDQVPNTAYDPRFSDANGRIYTASELVNMAADLVPRKPMGVEHGSAGRFVADAPAENTG